MKRALNLRLVDPDVCAQRNALLAAHAQDVALARLEQGQRYVSWSATIDARPGVLFIRLQELIDYWLGEASLPAEQIDVNIARAFVLDAFDAQGLPSPSTALVWGGPQGLAQPQDFVVPLFVLKGGPFNIFMSQLPRDFCRPPSTLTPDLPIDLQWLLGRVRVPLAALKGLSARDLVRLPAATGQLLAGQTTLFRIRILGDSLMLDHEHTDAHFDPFADMDETHDMGKTESAEHDVGDDAASVTLDLGQLPVTLSFALARLPLTVAEVSGLEAGMTLPLSQHTPYVDVMAGSVHVARGELVRIGQDLGVEILEITCKNPAPDSLAT